MSTQTRTEPARWFSGRACLIALQRHADARGTLMPLDFDALPFAPGRCFTVSDAPAGTVRGGHAHRRGQQLLICVQGRIDVDMRHGDDRARAVLEPNGSGLLIGPLVWATQRYLLPDSVLLVLASDPFDPTSYVEDAAHR
tara:strand:- start:58 stop:477 length:420 start_codon:yes stop_codon:yes gene_type:complete